MFDEYMSIILNYARVSYESKNDVRSGGEGVIFQLALHVLLDIQDLIVLSGLLFI